jgi:hypothetical protein
MGSMSPRMEVGDEGLKFRLRLRRLLGLSDTDLGTGSSITVEPGSIATTLPAGDGLHAKLRG